MGDQERASKTVRRGRDISVAVAIVSLIAALIFNGIQVRNSAQQIKQNQRSLALQRKANDFQTLIAVSSTLEKSQAQMDQILTRAHERSKDINSPANVGGLIAALRPNESIAFALNHGLVDVPGAKALWGNLLYCNWAFAGQTVYSGRFPRYFPELVAYVRRLRGKGVRRATRSCL